MSAQQPLVAIKRFKNTFHDNTPEGRLLDLARQSDTYSEYKMRCAIENLVPKNEDEFNMNKQGIILCPYIPVCISE